MAVSTVFAADWYIFWFLTVCQPCGSVRIVSPGDSVGVQHILEFITLASQWELSKAHQANRRALARGLLLVRPHRWPVGTCPRCTLLITSTENLRAGQRLWPNKTCAPVSTWFVFFRVVLFFFLLTNCRFFSFPNFKSPLCLLRCFQFRRYRCDIRMGKRCHGVLWQ